MDVFACAVMCSLLILPSQSEESIEFIIKHSSPYEKSKGNYTVTAGSTVTFICKYTDRIPDTVGWYKDTCHVFQSKSGTVDCSVYRNADCANMVIPLNVTCDEKYRLNIYSVQVHDNGSWFCGDDQKQYSANHYVIVRPNTPTASETGSTTHSTSAPSVRTSNTVRGSYSETTTRKQVQSTGSETVSNNFLLPVVGAAVGGVLIITIIVVVVVVKRKQSRKGGRERGPMADDNVPEVEVIDADGQYASIGQVAPTVAVLDVNPMYESYADDQNQGGSNSMVQGGDVYSVVQKKEDPPRTGGVETGGGDVYSVVQKKKEDPTGTDGVETAGGDVYSVVQKKKEDPPGTGGVETGGGDVYSVVQKKKEDPTGTGGVETGGGDVYSVVQKKK